MKFNKDDLLADVTYRTVRDFLRRRVGDRNFTADHLGHFLSELAGDDLEWRFLRNWEWKNQDYPRFLIEAGEPATVFPDEQRWVAFDAWRKRRQARFRSHGRKIIAAMVEAGLVEIVESSRTEYIYTDEQPPKKRLRRWKEAKLTQLGIQLRTASWAPRLSREKMERRLAAFLDRVKYVNEHPEEFLYEIPLVGVFGSLLDSANTDYGDIDIVYHSVWTDRLWNSNDGRAARMVALYKQDHPDYDVEWYFEEPGRIFGDVEMSYYPHRKLRRFVKRGDGYLSLHDLNENLKTTVKVYVENKQFLPEPRLQDWPKRVKDTDRVVVV